MMLLTSVMCFLVTFFTLIAFDTNMAIYNRITAQNAVDAAADSAALWQARGCNLIQHLNNLHHDVNAAAAGAESLASGACVAALVPMLRASCILCVTLPVIDATQHAFNEVVTGLQQVLVDLTPLVAFMNANACAKGSRADKLGEVVPEWVKTTAGRAMSELGLNVPAVETLFGGVADAIQGGLSWIPIYAAPLDPTRLSLYVEPKKGDSFPWEFSSWVGRVGNAAGRRACGGGYTGFYNAMKSAGWDGKWGWNDSYYFGHPGFMTWIAGTKNRDELLGLGSIPWLRGEQEDPEKIRLLYTGQEGTGSRHRSVLAIPPFLALASSQVEGTPVVARSKSDYAKGKLIKVYFSKEFPGENLGILH